MSNQPVLSIRGLRKEYPGVVALNDFSCSFREGEVHAIIGENGAGKSTLIKCIAGAISPDAGSIVLRGVEYQGMDPHLARRSGIEVIYQEFNLVPALSAAENVFLCEKTSKGPLVSTRQRERLAAEIFAEMKVNIPPSQKVREMSPASMQLVEIAKSISRDVKILIMDEPTAPLTVTEVEMLFGIVRALKARGVTILYISHRLEELFEIADRVTVMRDGGFIETRDIRNTNRQELIGLMTGRVLSDTYPERSVVPGEELLRVEGLTGNGVDEVNFTLRRGEVLGFAGLVGAGRTELMQVLYGAYPKTSGKVLVKGVPCEIRSPRDAIRYGIGYIPEDRKHHGCFLPFSIRWNSSIGAIRRLSRFGMVKRDEERALARKYAERFRLKTPSLEQLVLNLSGGNQQKVVLAKTMASETDILIFDEPTRGIDVGAKWEIYRLINELAEAGHGIIMVSSEMPELIGMSDRIVVICEGRQTGTLEQQPFEQTRILDLASGGVAAS